MFSLRYLYIKYIMKNKTITFEECHLEALKFNKRIDFLKNKKEYYNICVSNNWLYDICRHMNYSPKGYWTKEKCREEALKYKTKMEFKEKSGSAYTKSVREEWLDEICSHMEILKHKKGYWTKEKCREEALKYNTRDEFAKAKGWGYQTTIKNGWDIELFDHMKISGNLKKRCIYVYEFNDNSAYVGLTYNFDKRWYKRLLDEHDIVKIYMDKTNLIPKRIQLTDYIESKEASKLETYYFNIYKKNGWNMLNRVKTGSLGGDEIKWTYEICKEVALKYKTNNDFLKNDVNCLSSIYKKGWTELLSHLIPVKNHKNFWTYEKCLDHALTCETKKEFITKHKGAYSKAVNEKWLNDIYRITNLKDTSPNLKEISDELFYKILDDRNKNMKTIENLAKEYDVNVQRLRNKFKEKKIKINRLIKTKQSFKEGER